MKDGSPSMYTMSGVDDKTEEIALKRMIPILQDTFAYRKGVGECLIPIGHYAGIIKIAEDIGLALKTDGVGTKVFIAQMMNKYDTVGIDCVAQVVNDIICTGAEPLSVVDYLGVQESNPTLLEEITKGLRTGAKIAGVNIVGGEIAQLPDMINGVRPHYGFDLLALGVGIVHPKKIIDGHSIEANDAVIGIASSGIHTNGMSLARNIFFKRMNFDVHKYFDALGRTLGEELLEPTSIYVQEFMDLIRAGIHLKNVAHITSDGLLNLARTGENHGYVIEQLPQPYPIFELLMHYMKGLDLPEMYRVFNMGIGLCLVLPRQEIDDAIQLIEKHQKKAFVLGYARKDPEKKIILKPLSIIGDPKKGSFYHA